jgi:hypothetical protein
MQHPGIVDRVRCRPHVIQSIEKGGAGVTILTLGAGDIYLPRTHDQPVAVDAEGPPEPTAVHAGVGRSEMGLTHPPIIARVRRSALIVAAVYLYLPHGSANDRVVGTQSRCAAVVYDTPNRDLLFLIESAVAAASYGRAV